MAETNKKYRFETLQLHVGQEQADPATDSRASRSTPPPATSSTTSTTPRPVSASLTRATSTAV